MLGDENIAHRTAHRQPSKTSWKMLWMLYVVIQRGVGRSRDSSTRDKPWVLCSSILLTHPSLAQTPHQNVL